ncbi:hypothetical protein [Pectobacterium aroidearum]|uniref:hypothetical protein n=1 Tax=Pectobacterium aroidearum TaxID=1201031 RepID=UPI001CD59BD4|nr:hypothetical protein [Pectobacterium aroidearum]
MTDFASTKRNSTFAEWHDQLQMYAECRGGSAADAEAWREDYDAGKNPVDAYCDEWGDE